MRKIVFSALMMTLLLLAGCARQDEEDFAQFREGLRAAENVDFDLTLHCGGEGAPYALRVEKTGADCRVTVVQPELVAGVTVTVGPDGTELGCEGVSLGVETATGVTPVTAGYEMLRAMCYGYEELLWHEDDYLAARLWLDDGAVMTLWLDKDATPVCAEISEDGAVVMSAAFSGWELY